MNSVVALWEIFPYCIPMSTSQTVHLKIPSSLVHAIRRILRPVVRLLMRHQIQLPSLLEMVKEVYVEEAERSFRLEEKSPSDSRIHVLTGVHRKDVRRIRNQEKGDDAAPPAVSLAGRIVAYWTGDLHYSDEKGVPLELPKKTDGDLPSFETLVAGICRQDIRPRTILDELVSLGVVEEDEDSVRLNMDAFIPEQGFDEKCYYLGRNTSDHLTAAVDNVSGGEAPFPERSVYYDGLSKAAVDELKTLARVEGMKTLKKVNQQALKLKKSSGVPSERYRMNFGLYYFSTPQEPENEHEQKA